MIKKACNFALAATASVILALAANTAAVRTAEAHICTDICIPMSAPDELDYVALECSSGYFNGMYYSNPYVCWGNALMQYEEHYETWSDYYRDEIEDQSSVSAETACENATYPNCQTWFHNEGFLDYVQWRQGQPFIPI